MSMSFHDMFGSFLFLCCCCFFVSALSKQHVTHLPGFQGPLPFYLETGYVEVDALQEAHMFYYFIKSERLPKDDPLILWLTGGPGCSGLSSLLYEIGPLSFITQRRSAAVPTLVYRPDSWTKISNIIFPDAPFNAGFSYCRSGDAYHSSDTQMASQILLFLKKWLNVHPNFKSNPLYVAGDSYAGTIVPVVALEIAKDEKSSGQPFFNLEGYIVGNPVTDDKFDSNARVPFAHGMGLISNELYELAKRSCHGVYTNNKNNTECAKHVQAFLECVKDVNHFHILEANYPLDSPSPVQIYGPDRRELYEVDDNNKEPSFAISTIPSGSRYFRYLLSPIWANSDAVRESLGIRKGTISRWKRCKRYDPSWYDKDVTTAVLYHLNLTSRGYQALVYSGDHDMVVPHIGTQAWIRHLNFSIVDDWRPWFVKGQVAGYTRMYSNNLTFATVKGAGHTAPEYKSKECLAMFQRWIDYHTL